MSPYRKHLRVAGFVFGLVIQATSLSAQGVIGFDTRTARFCSTAVHSGAGAEFLTGTLNLVQPVVTFAPMAPTAGGQASESFRWTMVDSDHFIWAPLDRGWRAVLTRER